MKEQKQISAEARKAFRKAWEEWSGPTTDDGAWTQHFAALNAALQATPPDGRVGELEAFAQRMAAGHHGAARNIDGPCVVIHAGYPAGTTCLDKQALARDPSQRFGDDYRAAMLSPEYPCERCQARLALASTQPSNGRISEDDRG